MVLASEVFQPRASASRAARVTASRVALSRASKALRLTNTMFFGSQAWVS